MNKVLEMVLELTADGYPKDIPNRTAIFKAKDIWEACLQTTIEKHLLWLTIAKYATRKKVNFATDDVPYPKALENPASLLKTAQEKSYLDLEKSLIDNGWISDFKMSLMMSKNESNEPRVNVYNGNHRLSIMYLKKLNYDVNIVFMDDLYDFKKGDYE